MLDSLRQTLAPLVLVAAAALCASACKTAVPAGPPNKILLVTLDTTRADHLSAYGYERATSPYLDAIAAGGVRFARAYCAMPTTDPSHTTMLTGELPRTHGILHNGARRKDVDGPSLGAWLGEHGYHTASITARLGLDPKIRRIRGFDETDSPSPKDRWRTAAQIVDLTKKWLDARGDDEKWFLWVHLWEPHEPYKPPQRFVRPFLVPGADISKKARTPPRLLKPGKLVPPDIVDTAIRLYDGEIATADAAAARIVAMATQAKPRGSAPLVFVVGDHGEALAERQKTSQIAFGHGALIYDEVVHVPWIVSWKGRIDAHVVQTAVSLVDLAPTMAALVDPGDPYACEGRSLAETVTTGREPEPRPIVIERRAFGSGPIQELHTPAIAWMEWPWKAIVNDEAGRLELYRLDSDPKELHSLVGTEPERARKMLYQVRDWEKAHPFDSDKHALSPDEQAEHDALRSLGYID